MSTVELAKEYGCSDPTIADRLRENGVKIRSLSEAFEGKRSDENHPRYIKLPIEKICEKYLSGISTYKLAEEYKCAVNTINKKLRDNKIIIRLKGKIPINLSVEEICKKYLDGMC